MRADKSWAGAIAPVLMMMAVLLPVGGAAGAETSGYAPENIEQTYKQLSWLCMVRAFCPVTEPVRDVIKHAMAGNASAEYLLGLTLATGDGLPRDPSAAVAWIVRAAEHGDPDAARDIADRTATAKRSMSTRRRLRRHSNRRPRPTMPRQCVRSDRCISAAAASRRIRRLGSIS